MTMLMISGQIDFTVRVDVDEDTGEAYVDDIWSDTFPNFQRVLDDDTNEVEEWRLYRLGMKVADQLRNAIEPKLTTRTVHLED